MPSKSATVMRTLLLYAVPWPSPGQCLNVLIDIYSPPLSPGKESKFFPSNGGKSGKSGVTQGMPGETWGIPGLLKQRPFNLGKTGAAQDNL